MLFICRNRYATTETVRASEDVALPTRSAWHSVV